MFWGSICPVFITHLMKSFLSECVDVQKKTPAVSVRGDPTCSYLRLTNSADREHTSPEGSYSSNTCSWTRVKISS